MMRKSWNIISPTSERYEFIPRTTSKCNNIYVNFKAKMFMKYMGVCENLMELSVLVKADVHQVCMEQLGMTEVQWVKTRGLDIYGSYDGHNTTE
jgi:hypothetical protein